MLKEEGGSSRRTVEVRVGMWNSLFVRGCLQGLPEADSSFFYYFIILLLFCPFIIVLMSMFICMTSLLMLKFSRLNQRKMFAVRIGDV